MTVRVRAPATTANLGPGFDCAGAALELWNELELAAATAPSIATTSACARSSDSPRRTGWSFRFTDHIPQARGLGSSASMIALGLVAGAIVAELEPTADELLALGLELEGHGDNLAAALVGRCLPDLGNADRPDRRHDRRHADRGHPGSARSRRRRRAPRCRETVPHADAAFSAGRAALLGAALASGSADLFAAALDDRLHEPYRAATFAAARSDPRAAARGGRSARRSPAPARR